MWVGTYWFERGETREEAAQRLSSFLVAVGASLPIMSNWLEQGRSRRAALRRPIETSAEALAPRLRYILTDVGKVPMEELGLQFSAWNGRNASLSVCIGATSTRAAPNSVILRIDEDADTPKPGDLRAVLEAMIVSFAPDHGVVASNMFPIHGSMPWDRGYLTYHKGEGIRVGRPEWPKRNIAKRNSSKRMKCHM
jgi:hypothetical protein